MRSPKSFEENLKTLEGTFERSRDRFRDEEDGDSDECPICPDCGSKMIVEDITYCSCWEENDPRMEKK